MTQASIPAVIMRGGTSKGIFVSYDLLPPPGPARDALMLGLLGSPDPMQIDGLGGTYSSTSKVMAVGNAAGDGARIALLNKGQRLEASHIAQSVHYVETATDPGFQTAFVEAIHIPHAVAKFPHLADTLPANIGVNPDRKRRRTTTQIVSMVKSPLPDQPPTPPTGDDA